jgi:hypothetical protein
MKLEHVSQLDRELGDVIGAVELVSSGRADRVEVCNLRHARRVLALARASFADRPIDIRPIPREGSSRIDLVVERTRSEVTS